MLGLSATAAANSATRQAAAAALIAADPTGALTRFHDVVADSVFSSNVSADKVVGWDDAGEVLDTRSWSIAQSGGDVAVGLAAFALQQGRWLVRRQAFEDLWEHGRRFLYGALNAGGMGTEGRYGPFCVVIPDPEAHRPLALAVFPGDSAQRYTTEAGSVDAGAAQNEATTWADRAVLAVVHRSAEAHVVDAGRWFEVLCRADHYLEVVVVCQLPITAVAEVRMRQSLADRIRALRARSLNGVGLAPTESNEVRAYNAMRRWRRRHGTSIEMVA